MSRPVSIDEIRQLSVAERLLLVEEIWDSISTDADSWSLNADQEQELARRAAAHDASPDEGSSWEEIKAGLRSRS
jgi:putative addiction module component (TIGR02574 family)